MTEEKSQKGHLRWRPWLRAIHRDIGYLAIGLTFVYALSGLAVNHIGDGDWDPNFHHYEVTHQLDMAIPEDDQEASQLVLAKLAIAEQPTDVYPSAEDELTILLEDRTLIVQRAQGLVIEEGQKKRWLLRLTNWLHLNRGKQAWTYIADGYAVFLLFLAFSGIFMLPGRRGFFGRGAIFMILGIAIPVCYVVFSGGP